MHRTTGHLRLSSVVARQARRYHGRGDGFASRSSSWTTTSSMTVMAATAAATTVVGTSVYSWWWVTTKTDYYSKSRRHVTRLDDDRNDEPLNKKDKADEEKSIHNFFHNWTSKPRDLEALWKKFRHGETSRDTSQDTSQDSKAIAKDEPEASTSSWDFLSFQRISKDIMAFATGEGQEEAIKDLVAQVRAKQEWDIEDNTSFSAILDVINQSFGYIDLKDSKYGEELNRVAEKFIGDLDFSKIFPTALVYYMEHEDERKNPSFKRRMHRFYPGIRMKQLEDLHHSLQLAEICYADTAEEIKRELEERGYELVYADVTSAPGKPAHYVAVNRSNKTASAYWSPVVMQVVVGVRGTKTVADALTDLMCDSADFRGGQAHSYILTSGRYLVEKLAPLLKELSDMSGKKIQLSLVGHSLGAGAASIAGMELADQYDVQVVGFGCPALLSKDLAQQATFITTIVNDADVVPRTSGATIANLLMDVMEFDWLPYAKKDIQQALDELFPAQYTKSIMETVDPHLEAFVRSTVQPSRPQRLTPELYPPGRCIHFYSDGVGKSAAVVPNDFFKEIDVSLRMLEDHKCFNGYLKMMLDVMRDHKEDYNFTFEDKEQQPHKPG